MPKYAKGFTLIELVVVIAIVAILASIAIPSYTSQVRKSRRTEAITTLQDQQLKLERWRTDNASFATYSLPAVGSTYYDFTLSDANATDYKLTATPKGDQAKDSCGTLILYSQAGKTSKTVSGSGTCW